MKKFKLISLVVAIVFIIGTATSAFAATFSTNTTYDTNGNATVTTTVSELTEDDAGAQITYIAYKEDTIDANNILYVNQEEVTADNFSDFKFTYTVARENLSMVSTTAIGLGTDAVDSLSAANSQSTQIGGFTVEVDSNIENGTISLSENEVYPDSVVDVTITPNAHYEIDKLVVNGDDVAVSGNTYALTVEKDTVVSAVFKQIEVTITPDLTENEALQFADIETVAAEQYKTVDEEVVVLDDATNIPVKNILSKVIGNPAGYEYGMKVTLTDGQELYYKAYDINPDGTFAVRLIDISEEQNVFDDIVSVEAYLVSE